jgi:molecular chaperone GrpE
MTVESAVNKKKQSDEKKQSQKKKPNKYLAENKKLKEENSYLKDQLLRKTAEFDNYKKRTERDFYDRVLNANERLISEILPILDDLERSIDHAKNSEDVNSLLEGVELITKKLFGILEKQGLQKMEAQGKEFDPEKHEALMQIEKKDIESGIIVEEHLKGYSLNDKVVRHAQVIVSK